MRKRRKGKPGAGGNWMDTYGDMVTLLLTFFVMLYAMSDLNQQKWEIFVKSIYPNSSDIEQVSINQQPNQGTYDVTGSMKADAEPPEGAEMDKLYLVLAEALDEKNIGGVTISRGEGYTFIQFQDQQFFDGDSSVLTDQAKATLDIFCSVVAPESEGISQVDIMGHTAQGSPDRPNNPRTDRMLSSLRSAEVAAYIQEKGIIKPDKLVGLSYGQYRPVDTFETKEGRAKNRRVEILLIDADADIKALNEYYNEIDSGANADTTVVTGGDGFTPVDGSPEGEASMLPENPGGPEGTPETVPEAVPEAPPEASSPEGAPE